MQNPRAQIAALPLHQDGVSVGVLIGLRLGLEAVDAERSQLAADHQGNASGSPMAACVAFADGRLLAAMRVIATRFRQ